MFGWLREVLEIRLEYRERKIRLAEEAEERKHVCQSCEVLKTALERANFEKDQLLRELLSNDNDQPIMQPAKAPEPINRAIPWKVRQQMLESEDRQKAASIARFKKEQEEASKINTSNLEKSIGLEADTK